MRTTVYHVHRGARRTTVTLDTVLSAYLALRLETVPETPPAYKAVRRWLQQRLDEDNDPGRCAVSQWLHHEVIEVIADNNLSRAYTNWLLENSSYLTPLTHVK